MLCIDVYIVVNLNSVGNGDTLKFENAAEAPVKFQNDAIIRTTNLAASRLCEILR